MENKEKPGAFPRRGLPAHMTLFSGGKEVVDDQAGLVVATGPTADPEVTVDGTEAGRGSSDQPSWPKRLLDAYVESVRQSSAYADQVGRLALSGDIGGALKAAIGLR